MIKLDYERLIDTKGREYVDSVDITHDDHPTYMGYVKHVGDGLYRFRINQNDDPAYINPNEMCLTDAIGLILTTFMSK
jgi:hypothetical protein